MARRHFSDQPPSGLAIWAGRLALFSLAMAALSVIIVRSGLLEIVPALATFAVALAFAAIAVVLAFVSFVVIWKQGLAGLGYALLALFIGGGLIAYPAYLGYRAYRLPPITDIATDPANPPRFDVTARLRPRGTNEYPGGAVAEKQRAAYPDIEPMQLSTPPQVVYEVALAVATKRKWRVVDARPPMAGRRDGSIEAVARTPIMGFRDDIVIRIRAASGGSRVDIRSASRYGFHDFGANASRVRALIEDIDDAVGSLPVEKKPPEKPAQPPGKRPAAKR
jgi:uncharacterized protein (DUF1499 family)